MSFRRSWLWRRPSAGTVFYWAYQDAKREARRGSRSAPQDTETQPYILGVMLTTGAIFALGLAAGFNGNPLEGWITFWGLFLSWLAVAIFAMRFGSRIKLPKFWDNLLGVYGFCGMFTIAPLGVLVALGWMMFALK